MREFLDVAVTLIARTIFGMGAYFAMTVSATQLGTTAIATHQVAMQVSEWEGGDGVQGNPLA